MRQVSFWLMRVVQGNAQTVWHRLSRPNRRICKVILVLVSLALTLRSLPYLAPIHAQDIVQDRQAIEFIDRNGLPLGTLLTRDSEHTSVVPLSQVSPQFIQAILAAEDRRFYQHGALDIKAIGRSLFDSIQARKITSGASTITMQLARMLDPVPRTLSGKLREIWLSWRLAAGMNSDEILSAYINRLPMGGNIYGIEAAARIYFAIPAAELNLARASLLAALPNNPTYFNPYSHWERLKRRQTYVLDRMVQNGYITRTSADLAYAETLTLAPRQQGIIAAPHFLFWLAKQINSVPLAPPDGFPPLLGGDRGGLSIEGGARGAGGGSLLRQHSSVIRTTLDRPLQQFVEAQVKQIIHNLAPNNVHHAAALVIDNHTGEVLAYVGSPDYFDEAKFGRNDGVQALRQPGSTLKPFLYQLALENGIIRPNTILADVPTYYAIPGAKLYNPTDYNETFIGPVRVRVALANSLNVPAVRVLEKVGVQNFLERLHQLGFEHLTHPPEYYGLGLTLGSGEVSLWELARAYVTLARFGEVIPIVTANHILHLEAEPPVTHSQVEPGNELNHILHLEAEPPVTHSQVEPGNELELIGTGVSWELITDILSDAHARATAFGVDSVLNLPFPAAVKTGTSSNFRDTWTVGFTTDYTVATWVGNFNGDRMRQVSGVMGAAPLWNRIMLRLHSHQEPAAFPPPETLVLKPICAISGKPPTPACSEVVQEYFYPEDLSNYDRQLNTSRQLVSQKIKLSDDIKIVSPGNGDVFLLNPSALPGKSSRLEFKLAKIPTQPVEWWLNDRKLATNSSNSLFWLLNAGKWTLEVKMGTISDRVSFQVQLSLVETTRRGFSIANPP